MRLDAFQRYDLHEALDPAALGNIEAPHSALPQQAQQLVAAECLSHEGGSLLRVRRMSSLAHAETLSTQYARWFRANNRWVCDFAFVALTVELSNNLRLRSLSHARRLVTANTI